jgi:hypothetical protein
MPRSLVVFEANALFLQDETKLSPDAERILNSKEFVKLFVAVEDPKFDQRRVNALRAGNWFNGHCEPRSE